jgi:hypothetical protein
VVAEEFPSYIVTAESVLRVVVARDKTQRTFKRDLKDFEIHLYDLLSCDSKPKRTRVGVDSDLVDDFRSLKSPVQLEWLRARLLVHHVITGTLKDLGAATGPVLTMENYEGYMGETVNADDAKQAVVQVLKVWLGAGVQEPIPQSVLFASTNFDIRTLRCSINALIAQGFLAPLDGGEAYTIDAGVLKLPQLAPTRHTQPSPVSRYYQEIAIEADRPFCFVIMPFKETECPQLLYFEVIKPLLVKEFDVRCYRVDEDRLPDRIDNKIYTYMVQSEFMIAEISTRNPNVMYELGLAHALNKPCILLSKSELSDLPFDISRISVEPYADDESLREYLLKTVSAMLGRSYPGPELRGKVAAKQLPVKSCR